MAALNRQSIRLCPGGSGLVKPVNIKKSSAYHRRGDVRDERRIPAHAAEQHWFTVRHVQSKIGKAVTVLWGLSSTRDLAEGQVQLSGAARQRVLPGWAGGVWLRAQFSNGKAQSYPKIIFLSVDHVEQAPVCQAKQYITTRGLIQTHLQSESPGVLQPRELGSAFGSFFRI